MYFYRAIELQGIHLNYGIFVAVLADSNVVHEVLRFSLHFLVLCRESFP